MTIKIITGVPGAGKSLCLVDEACKLRDEKNPEYPNRQLFAVGIDGLRAEVAVTISPEDLENWRDLPDGSIVLVDEAWKHFVPHSPTKQPPEWVTALAEHRHRGFDFILATQHPTQLSKFVRDLCPDHTHLVRKFGTHNVQRIHWESVHTDTKSKGSIGQAQVSLWRFPKARFDLYQSATMHTVKRRVPKRVYVALGLCLLLPALAWAGWRSLHHLADMDAVQGGASVPAAAASVTLPSRRTARQRPISPAEWANQRLPRVHGVPWSAPMWDDLKTTTVPDLLCIEHESDNRQAVLCDCYTEQVTPLPNVPDKICRQAAEHGVYNPYRPKPDKEVIGRASESDALAASADAAPSSRSASSVVSGIPGVSGQSSAMRADYHPPESVKGDPIHMLPSGPDAWAHAQH